MFSSLIFFSVIISGCYFCSPNPLQLIYKRVVISILMGIVESLFPYSEHIPIYVELSNTQRHKKFIVSFSFFLEARRGGARVGEEKEQS